MKFWHADFVMSKKFNLQQFPRNAKFICFLFLLYLCKCGSKQLKNNKDA